MHGLVDGSLLPEDVMLRVVKLAEHVTNARSRREQIDLRVKQSGSRVIRE